MTTDEEVTQEERDRIASGLYRSARARGASAVDLKGLVKLRTGKTRTRDCTADELLTLREEVLRLPTLPRERRAKSETPTEYEERRRKERLTK